MLDPAYITYLAHFHGTRDYFECHEILEERWKQDRPLDRHSIFVAFIQLAVALYHHRRNNFTGAQKMLKKGRTKFFMHEHKISSYGLHKEKFFLLLNKLETNLEEHIPYKDIDLPITDELLIEAVQVECRKLDCVFPSPSNLHDPFLIHKHIYHNKEEKR